jgi:hypothetical protein
VPRRVRRKGLSSSPMKLADRVARCREPFRVRNLAHGQISTLNNVADCARAVQQCGLRFVLSDEQTQLCAALAYSKGACALGCADRLHIPAELVWVEWSYFAWQRELARYGLRAENASCAQDGRRGTLISSTPCGRRGTIRTFWTNDNDTEVLASSIEGWFDLDTAQDEDPKPPHGDPASILRIEAPPQPGADVLKRCFRFRYERNWKKYYDDAPVTLAGRDALARHALATIAADIPLVLVFFLLRRESGAAAGLNSGQGSRPNLP